MNPALPISRLPSWFRQEIPGQETLDITRLLSKKRLHSVCQQARCPNMSRCFKDKEVTFIILGDTCSRNCRFCGVKKNNNIDSAVDRDEPQRVAEAVRRLGLNYVVITSVTRDDLDDGGAEIFFETIKSIRHIDKNINPVRNPNLPTDKGKISNGIKIELLIPDFKGDVSSIGCVVAGGPDVLAHNIETVEGLYRKIRPMADYGVSLRVLSSIKAINRQMLTKSSIMLGLGEKEKEVMATMRDLRRSGCDILTLGQYLAPSSGHYPVKEFIIPRQFGQYEEAGYALGFKKVFSGPLVRSSFRAGDIYREAVYA